MESLKFNDLAPLVEDWSPNTVNTPNTIASLINDPTKAPGRLPYPLDTILDEFADTYLKLQNAREMLDAASTNKALTKIQRLRLAELRDKIALASKTVRKVAEEVNTNFTLEV
jgi:plasmid maintenance system antidote protein VapI